MSAMKMKLDSIRRVNRTDRPALANLAMVVTVVALERFPGELWWPTLLLAYLPQELWLIPSIVLTACLLARRRWGAAAGTAVVGVAALTMLLGVPIPQAESRTTSDLRVATWNLNYGRGGKAVPELALAAWPDVICLQEANPWAHNGLPALLKLPQFGGWHYKVCGELVILSRFPLKRLGTTHSALWVSADVDGREVVIVNVHMAIPFRPGPSMLHPGKLRAANSLRMSQVEELLASLPTDRPAIICGDFNTPPNTRIYRALASALTNSFQRCGRGAGLSFLTALPLVRIDHIFLTKDVLPVRCWMPRVRASNHRPVCADIHLSQSEFTDRAEMPKERCRGQEYPRRSCSSPSIAS